MKKNLLSSILILSNVLLAAASLAGCEKKAEVEKVVYVVPNDKYEYNACFVSFNGNGGSGDLQSKVIVKGEKYGDLPIPELAGCDFAGWYTDKEEGELITSDSIFPTDGQDCVLYARYESRPGTWEEKDGKKYYTGDDGRTVKNDWRYIDGLWYVFDSEGAAITGWYDKNGTKYYLNHDGSLATGWRRFEAEWYYFNPYPSGTMAKGWTKIDNDWYYFDEEGKKQSGWLYISGKWYLTNSAGIMKSGWQEYDGGVTYYLDEISGVMAKGWTKIEGNIYYFADNGALVRDQMIGDRYVNAEGILSTVAN